MLQGYKTFLGIAITFLGILGFGGIISEGEAEKIINLTMELAGLVLAVYGRIKAVRTY